MEFNKVHNVILPEIADLFLFFNILNLIHQKYISRFFDKN